jgi:hypothetical protein
MNDLENLYKATPQEQIEAKVYGSEEDSGSSSQKGKKAPEKQGASSKSQLSDDLDF